MSTIDIISINRHILGILELDSHRKVAADLNLDQMVNNLDRIELRQIILNYKRPEPPRSWDFFNMYNLGSGNNGFAQRFIQSPWDNEIDFPNYLDVFDDNYAILTGPYNIINYGLCRTSSTGWKYGDLNNNNSDIYQATTYTMGQCDYAGDPGIIDNTVYPDPPSPSSEEVLDFSSHIVNITENGSPQNNFSVIVSANSTEDDILAFQVCQMIPDGFVLDSMVFNNSFKTSGAYALVNKSETGKSYDEIRIIWDAENLVPVDIEVNDWIFTLYGSILATENDFFKGQGALQSYFYSDGYDSLASTMNLHANVIVSANRPSFQINQNAGAVMTISEKDMNFKYELSDSKGIIMKQGEFFGKKMTRMLFFLIVIIIVFQKARIF